LTADPVGGDFGDLFRAVNLDAGKQMTDTEDYGRLMRLMCPNPEGCVPGPVRLWDKVEYGRFVLESPVSNRDVFSMLNEQGFPIMWTLRGTPAFLNSSCTGCVVEGGSDTYHVLREIELSAEDERNPSGVDIECQCDDEHWYYNPPVLDTVAGVSWLDYVDRTLSEGLDLMDSPGQLRFALWNEPDTNHWYGTQNQFVQMWCTSLQRLQETVEGRDDVLIGGPDVSSWAEAIRPADLPLLQAIQEECGGGERYDFLTYHHYSEPGRFLLEDSVGTVRSWADDESLIIDVGEYASSLGYGAAAVSVCDPTAIASMEGEVPTPTGVDDTSILCDHRGAVEDAAMAASMAGQDHDRLYRFEVWDWGTTDMVDSRMGLLTLNNLPKPAATAFWMLSHLQGEKLVVANELGGEQPHHVLAARDGDEIFAVVVAQNRTVSQQFVRGLLEKGLEYQSQVAPGIAGCSVFETDDEESTLSALATAATSSADLIDACPGLDPALAEALADALAFAAPRVGHVGEGFDITLRADGWWGQADAYRLDAYRNTFAEAYRRWPDRAFATDGFDFEAAEAELWDYMTEPVSSIASTDGTHRMTIRPDSVTLLRWHR